MSSGSSARASRRAEMRGITQNEICKEMRGGFLSSRDAAAEQIPHVLERLPE